MCNDLHNSAKILAMLPIRPKMYSCFAVQSPTLVAVSLAISVLNEDGISKEVNSGILVIIDTIWPSVEQNRLKVRNVVIRSLELLQFPDARTMVEAFLVEKSKS
jgi:hypothetical protein